MTELLIDATTW